MGYGTSDKPTTSTRLDVSSKDRLKTRVGSALSWRRSQLPFPLDKEQVEEIVTALYGPEVRQLQLRLAELAPMSLEWASGVKMNVSGNVFVVPHQTHENGTPVVETGWKRPPDVLPHDSPHYGTLLTWIQGARDIDREIHNAASIVHSIIDTLGTYGQMLRLWPGVAQWLPDRGKLATSAQQTRRSSLPTDYQVSLRTDSGSTLRKVLKLWEVKAELEKIDTLLAVCLMARAATGEQTEGNYYTKVWI
jgi:hypothetical protein